VSNIFKYLAFLILLNNCSLDTKSRIWTSESDLISDRNNETQLFIKKEPSNKQFNSQLKVKLTSKLINNSFVNNTSNNNGRVNYDGKLKKISKFKFSKINNFDYYEPELIFESDNLIFFNNKGSIMKFDLDSNIIWKKNYYNKGEKKLKPVLTFGSDSKTLIVADNVSKYYALNLDDGNLLWSKYNSSPFNSQIKTYKDKFFIIDFNNVLRCISIKDGTDIWNIKVGNTFIKSQKKLSIIVVNNVVYFNNSTGDITAIDINTGIMLWQTPTQASTIYENTFLLKTSNIVANNKMIVFSNNKNEFYSLDLKTGLIKWKININSNVQPTIIDNLIFTISNEGYLTIIDSKDGNIIKVTDVFSLFKKKKRNKINPVGFLVAKKNIYLTTDHGRLLVIDIESGETKSIIKIANNKISRPFILNKNLFLIKDNSIIKLD
jgi:outer membrane protein assembly factor BamB